MNPSFARNSRLSSTDLNPRSYAAHATMADSGWRAPDGYDDTNRAFLQAFMARGAITFVEGRTILAGIMTAAVGAEEPIDPLSITMEDFTQHIKVAREAVEGLDYDIRVARHEVHGERMWVFINAHSDPSTQLATTRSAEELAYIKRLLDAIFAEHNTPRLEVMAIDEAQALKVSRPQRPRESGANSQANGEGSAAADRGLKHSEVLSLLSSLVEEGWLEKSRNGFYSLSPRSLVELWQWLVQTYNEPEDDWQNIKFCEACKEIITYGQRCPERDCNARLHDICEEGYWRTRREKKCPKCSRPWDRSHFVGERAVTTRPGFQNGRGRRGNAKRSTVEETNEDETN